MICCEYCYHYVESPEPNGMVHVCNRMPTATRLRLEQHNRVIDQREYAEKKARYESQYVYVPPKCDDCGKPHDTGMCSWYL